ncbi:MAG: ABC transporter substrate-binding protein [Clostridia bacterium]|nr:ABC transporter substrate-binding protein [Clostridia bacterium]
MQDTIYTIPVTEVYEKPCECPLCALQSRFEQDRIRYYLGPSLMEPDNRIETNNTGFCGRHFSMMYATQTNRLGLGLILDTYMEEQNNRMRKLAGDAAAPKEEKKSFLASLKPQPKDSAKAADAILAYWETHERECCICRDLEKTMDRYIEVICHLYFTQPEFRERFDGGMGYCMKHFTRLLAYARTHLHGGKQDAFLTALLRQQQENLDRMQEEVNWFTKKFDYRNAEAPWGNSRDALPRSICKMTGLGEIGTDGN